MNKRYELRLSYGMFEVWAIDDYSSYVVATSQSLEETLRYAMSYAGCTLTIPLQVR